MTEIQLSRRTILLSMVVVALATAAAGAGTMALFQDAETSTNTVDMGTLNLSVNGQNEAVQQLNVWGVEPGYENSSSVLLSNDGSVDGFVDVEISPVTDEENDCTEPESEVDDSCAAGTGELSEHMTVTVFFDTDNDDSINRGPYSNEDPIVENATLADVAGQEYDTDFPLASGQTTHLRVRTAVPETAGNEIQSDAAEFNLTVQIDQTDQN
jgi:predicted ribosomally synthesized peptide with SipW-like signal peptide